LNGQAVRTPAGTECPHYFEDFHRGRNRQECRLIARNPQSPSWKPEDCRACRVPRIVQANACQHLILNATVSSGVLGLGRRVDIRADCLLSLTGVAEPEIGCGRCHESFLPEVGPNPQP
jgi:hypothetical protein